jgi:hypothetical protein
MNELEVTLTSADVQNLFILFARTKSEGLEEAQVLVALAAKFQQAAQAQAKKATDDAVDAEIARRTVQEAK